jgi:hypothetical protein
VDDQSSESLSPDVVLGEGGWNRNFARVLLIEELSRMDLLRHSA